MVESTGVYTEKDMAAAHWKVSYCRDLTLTLFEENHIHNTYINYFPTWQTRTRGGKQVIQILSNFNLLLYSAVISPEFWGCGLGI